MHTTNYFDTFIAVAEDSKASCGTPPQPKKGGPSVAELQYDMIAQNPYRYSSDDVIFEVFAQRNDLTAAERPAARAQFFSKGQPCLRASPLTKTHGFGIHSDSQGRVALYGVDTAEYHTLLADPTLKQTKAMRSSKK
jgi:hypothetical protein